MTAAVRSSAASLREPAVVALAGTAVLGLLRVHDPHVDGSYGFCPFLLVTGQPCPGCGGLRAVNDLTRGDLVGAVSANAAVVVLLVVLGVAWVAWVLRRLRGVDDRMIVLSTRTGLAVLAGFVLFGIIRLTPPGSWLAP